MVSTAQPTLDLRRLILVGAVVPAIYVVIDQHLLAQANASTGDWRLTVLLLSTFIIEIGVLGVLCGRLIDHPLLRWIVYGWCWLLIDLQTYASHGFTPRFYYGDPRILANSLFAAQLGLICIWAVLGTTRWAIRLPAALILGSFFVVLLLQQQDYYYGVDFNHTYLVQSVALLAICGVFRWRRFRLALADDPTETSDGSSVARRSRLRSTQFGVRDVLIWTTSLALVLGLLRALDLLSFKSLSRYMTSEWLALISTGIVIAIVFVVAMWAALGEGKAWQRWLTLIVVCLGVGTGFIIAEALWNDYSPYTDFFGAPQYPSDTLFWNDQFDRHWWMLAWVCLAGGLLFAALLIFRTLGYRLRRPLPPMKQTTDPTVAL